MPLLAQQVETIEPLPSMEVPIAPSAEPADLIYSPDYSPEALPQYPPEAFTSELCGSHNTSQQVEGYVIGDRPDVPYVVVVPGSGDELLNTVRQCVIDAYQTDSGRGNYIRAGAFADRSTAEQLSRHLRSLDLDARVVYSP